MQFGEIQLSSHQLQTHCIHFVSPRQEEGVCKPRSSLKGAVVGGPETRRLQCQRAPRRECEDGLGGEDSRRERRGGKLWGDLGLDYGGSVGHTLERGEAGGDQPKGPDGGEGV